MEGTVAVFKRPVQDEKNWLITNRSGIRSLILELLLSHVPDSYYVEN